ncbi:MAG TPA: class I SAM-dependent methyltransferase [Patescibacteria group bacterium]
MFGKEYAKYPEILFDSFTKMKDEYEKKSSTVTKNEFLKFLITQYIDLFGVPEIGMQIRFMHFKSAINSYFPKKMKEILDAGSGIGGYVLELRQKYPSAFITGGEIDTKKILLCKKLFNDLHVKKVTFQKIDIVKSRLRKEKYNLIINVDVLEHIKPYKKALKNLSDALRKGGYLFIHTPHNNQKRIFSFTKGWHHADHVREGFSLPILVKDVEKSGLSVVHARRVFGPFGRFSWELNHFFLEKSFILAGITYPILYLIAQLDRHVSDSQGLGIVIVAKKL